MNASDLAADAVAVLPVRPLIMYILYVTYFVSLKVEAEPGADPASSDFVRMDDL